MLQIPENREKLTPPSTSPAAQGRQIAQPAPECRTGPAPGRNAFSPPKNRDTFFSTFSESQLGEFRLPLQHWGKMRQEHRAVPPHSQSRVQILVPMGGQVTPASWAKASTELWMCKMLTHKYEPVHLMRACTHPTSQGGGWEAIAWLEKGGTSHKPLMLLCNLDKDEAVWLHDVGPGLFLQFKAAELSPKSH